MMAMACNPMQNNNLRTTHQGALSTNLDNVTPSIVTPQLQWAHTLYLRPIICGPKFVHVLYLFTISCLYA
jgi:hypothetical protein